MQPETAGGRFQDSVLPTWWQRRHRQRTLARGAEDIVRVVAGNADLPFRFFVVGLEIVVRDGPVVERAAFHRSVSGAQAEILFHETPCHGAIAEGASANAGGVVAVGRHDAGR